MPPATTTRLSQHDSFCRRHGLSDLLAKPQSNNGSRFRALFQKSCSGKSPTVASSQVQRFYCSKYRHIHGGSSTATTTALPSVLFRETSRTGVAAAVTAWRHLLHAPLLLPKLGGRRSLRRDAAYSAAEAAAVLPPFPEPLLSSKFIFVFVTVNNRFLSTSHTLFVQ